MHDQTSETDLARKLIETFHLNVAERKSLPGGTVSLRTLVSIVRDTLSDSGWFPRNASPNISDDGSAIEARRFGYRLYTRHEIGVMKYGPIQTNRVLSLEKAVRMYLKHYSFQNEIDGVPIDPSK